MSRVDHSKRNKQARAAGNYAIAAPEKRKKHRKSGPDPFKKIREQRMKPGLLALESAEFERKQAEKK